MNGVNWTTEKEVECSKGRSFEKGVTCLCCMGGNCYILGHVLEECECKCLQRKALEKSKLQRCYEWIAARAFKLEYIRTEGEFHGSKRIRRELGVGCRDVDLPDLKENKRVIPGGITDNDMDIMGVKSCRRFLNDGRNICRVEYGACGQKDCGGCSLQEERWQSGIHQQQRIFRQVRHDDQALS